MGTCNLKGFGAEAHTIFLGIAIAALAFFLALAVLFAGPSRIQNRRLAVALILEAAIWFGAFGLLDLSSDRQTVHASLHLTRVATAALPFAYLLFIGTVPSPMSRTLRRPGLSAMLWAGLAAVFVISFLRPEYFTIDGQNGPIAEPARAAVGVTSLLGLFAAGWAWLGSPLGTMSRRQGAAYTLAFGTRDLGLLVYLSLLYGTRVFPGLPVAREVVHIYELAFTFGLFYILLAYGILKAQLLDIDLRLKRSIRRGVVAVPFFVVFIVGLEAISAYATQQLGFVAGVLMAAVLLVAIRPIQRTADLIAERLFPNVHQSAAYLSARKEEVYRAALESALHTNEKLDDSEFFRDLRTRLAISVADHQRLLMVARSQQTVSRRRRFRTDRFRVVRELGRGSSGHAFLATDLATGKQVVLKQPLLEGIPDARARARYIDEAGVLLRLDHPGIVKCREILEIHGAPTLVLDFEAGGSLADRLRDHRPVAEATAIGMADDLLDALDYLHRRGVVHRDIKPANILFSAAGRPKLADLGVAFVPRAGDVTQTILSPEGQPGSVPFMSPEQARGEPLGISSDLYSLATVIYLAMAGHPYLPFGRVPDFEARRLIQEAEPLFPDPRISKSMQLFLSKALAKDARRRHPTAGAARRALRSAMGGARSSRGADGPDHRQLPSA